MSDMTVGPIQTYVGDSILSSPTTSQNPVQDNISVTLTDSNLWLVDTSKLNGQTGNPQTQFTLLNLQTKYQTTVPFDNVNFTAATVAPTGLATTESAYLHSNLPQGSALMLASVTGGTQLSSDGMSMTSAGSSGRDSGGASSSGSSGGLSGAGGSAGSAGSSTASGSSSNSSSTGQSTQAVPKTSATVSPKATVSPQATVSPKATVSPQAAVPVPFDVSPTLGLMLILLMVGYRWLFQKVTFKSIDVKAS